MRAHEMALSLFCHSKSYLFKSDLTDADNDFNCIKHFTIVFLLQFTIKFNSNETKSINCLLKKSLT